MNFLRRHWQDLGMALNIPIIIYLIFAWNRNSLLDNILWISLMTLFFHQFEEYHFPGNFPKMINTVMFNSKKPEKYPLNSNSALIINVIVGWGSYLLAAILGQSAIWLGIATILVSLGNVFAHGILFNVKGRSLYNPGMITALIFFFPISIIFFMTLIHSMHVSYVLWIIGIILGLALNYLGIIKMIDWLKDKNTKFSFN